MLDKISKMKKREQELKQLGSILSEITAVYQKFYEENHIHPIEVLILYELYINDRCTQKSISVSHHLPKQTVNNFIQEYLKKGYVSLKKDPEDGRNKIIQLTEEGNEYLHKNLDPVLELDQKAYETIGDAEYQKLIEMNQKYLITLKQVI